MQKLSESIPVYDPDQVRKAQGIKSVDQVESPFSKVKGASPSAKLGLSYERAVLKAFQTMPTVTQVIHNPWFKFLDNNGSGYASPDILVFMPERILIIEVKLTWTQRAVLQLIDLYLPIIDYYKQDFPSWPRKITPLVVAKNLNPAAPRSALTLGEALTMSAPLLLYRPPAKLI